MKDVEIIECLKKDGKGVVIYGNANHAGLVYDYLLSNGVEAEAFMVDDAFYKAGTDLRNKPVKAVSDICLEEKNIVLGFCNVQKTKFLLQNAKILRGSYYLLWEPLAIYTWDEKYISDNAKKLDEIENKLSDNMSKEILRTLKKAKVNCDASDMIGLADDNQYFNELTYSIDSSDEVFCDCGAFNGDTIGKFIKFTGEKYKKIYAFEPNDDNAAQLRKNVGSDNNIVIVNKGTWSKDDTLRFSNDGSASLVDESGETVIEVTSIDNTVKDDAVTFIKMDVEGSEMESLIGATNTIRRNMPKLAICCYHKEDDIINFYDFLTQFNNDEVKYNFYLRHHSNSVYETVFYAIPVKR